MVAFRREKYVPAGGPAGGDGGRGGDVIFKVDEGLNTLMDFRYRRHFKAHNGESGMSKGKHGKGAEDLYIAVPPGTVVRNIETNEVIADLTVHEEEAIIAKGGRGGRGNIRFATPQNPAPQIAENGEPGEELEIELELKVIADVGLIGFPSVGKSTLLSVLSAAKPKIGSYPFTTLVPNLGMVDVGDGRHFVMADMPGIIEGAAEGVGLGLEFLRHIERTHVLLHVLDMSGLEGCDAFEDYMTIQKELQEYDESLLEKPQIIVANKMDMPDAEVMYELFMNQLSELHLNEMPPIYKVSAVAHKNLQPLILKTAELLAEEKAKPPEEIIGKDTILYTLEQEPEPFQIQRDPDGTWVIIGQEIERLYHMTNLDFDESLMRFSRQMRHMGIDDALRERGAKDGDLVRIDDFIFEFVD
ncbi:GTPase ObgE [Allofustis seminis]|uniref:GTPase ObgE n=1 Tax=Allofustis seminis TaxID=166939 RepID=UPI003CCBC033